MLSRKLANTILQKANKNAFIQARNVHFDKRAIGDREIVGYGMNSRPQYMDRTDFPFPAIRYKENKGDIIRLREKEKSDWKNLTLEEKKALYRASFCQTFSEIDAPTGEWKVIIGRALVYVTVSIWVFLWMRKYVERPSTSSLDEDRRRAQLRKMVDLKKNPVTGIASKWDYEKDDWKK